jgi:hypothetical protein
MTVVVLCAGRAHRELPPLTMGDFPHAAHSLMRPSRRKRFLVVAATNLAFG